MTIIEIVSLALFGSSCFISLVGFGCHYFLYHYLLNKTDYFIKKIEAVNSKKINFKLRRAYVHAKQNSLFTDLVASWTVSSKEMRTVTAMASLHTKSLINLIKEGKLIQAWQYSRVLKQSTLIFEEQWNKLMADIDEFNNFASHPSSILLDLKRIYVEIITLCKKILKDKSNKTTLLLENSSLLVERLFEKFDEVIMEGNYNHAYKIISDIQTELITISEILSGVPYMVYLIEKVFRTQRKKFINTYKLARKEGLVLERLRPKKRFIKIKEKIISYNAAFLAKEASSQDVADMIIDEIINLSKLYVVLNAEIKSNNTYFHWYAKVIDWINQLKNNWEQIQNNGYLKFYPMIVISTIDQDVNRVNHLVEEHNKLKRQPVYPYYTDLLISLIQIVEEATNLNETLKENVNNAIQNEARREKAIVDLITAFSQIKNFWEKNSSISYLYIHEYFDKVIKNINKIHKELIKKLKEAMYADLDLVIHEMREFLDKIRKFEWEIDTLITNERHIRKLYEIANRYRKESSQISLDLDLVEKLILRHNIMGAYNILQKIIKQYSAKDLKKFPIVLEK